MTKLVESHGLANWKATEHAQPVVPEPSTMAMGLAGAFFKRKQLLKRA